MSKSVKKRRLITAFAGAVFSIFLYKAYLYTHDRSQYEDSNLLVSLVFILIAAAFIYLLLSFISIFTSSKE